MKAGAKGEPVSMPGPGPRVSGQWPSRADLSAMNADEIDAFLVSIGRPDLKVSRDAQDQPGGSIVEKDGPKTSPPIPGRTPVLERGRR